VTAQAASGPASAQADATVAAFTAPNAPSVGIVADGSGFVTFTVSDPGGAPAPWCSVLQDQTTGEDQYDAATGSVYAEPGSAFSSPGGVSPFAGSGWNTGDDIQASINAYRDLTTYGHGVHLGPPGTADATLA